MNYPLVGRAALLALAVTLSACGTTVPLSQQVPTGTVPGAGASDLTGQTGSGSAASDPGTTPGESAGSVPGGSSSTGSGATAVAQGGPVGQPSGPGTGAASSALRTPITIGVSTIDYSQLARQFGANLPSSFYDGYKALIAAINKRGGLAGRQIKAIYHTQNGAASNYATEAQQTCATFTQDNKVDVVITYIMAQPDLAACLKAKGVTQIDNQQYAMTDGELATYPNYLNPAGITLERTAKVVLGGSAQAGVLKPGTVVGVITADCASNAYTNATLLPALAKKYGFKVVNVQLHCFSGVQDLGQDVSQIQNAVLKFRSAGATEVFGLTGSEGFVMGEFAQSAKQQNYFPGYLVSSNLFPWSQTVGGQYPQEALDKMRGFGWTPYIDTGDRNRPGPELAQQRVCDRLDPTRGNLASSDPKLKWNAVHFFYAECDQLLLLGKLLEATGGQTRGDVLRTAYERVVGRFQAAAAYDGQITGRFHDSPALMQRIAYTSSCQCFVTVGGRLRIPD
jgi:hypothetical protein